MTTTFFPWAKMASPIRMTILAIGPTRRPLKPSNKRMNPVHPRHGSPGPFEDGNRLVVPLRRGGFTLLELCMVLFIIALLFGLAMPSVESAFVEQGVRRDAHQLALMVKTAMMQSA